MIASKMGQFVFKLGLIKKKTQLCLQQQQNKHVNEVYSYTKVVWPKCLAIVSVCTGIQKVTSIKEKTQVVCKMPFKTLWLKNSYKHIS